MIKKYIKKYSVVSYILGSIRHIKTAGLIFPTSTRTIKKMMQEVDWSSAKVIVEYGGGNGNITEQILENLGENSRLICFEVRDDCVEILQQIQDPRLIVAHDSAQNLEKYLEKIGATEVCYFLSSLPFTLFKPEIRDHILTLSSAKLKPTGRYVQYLYSKSGYDIFKENFTIKSSKLSLFNIPPAYIFTAAKK